MEDGNRKSDLAHLDHDVLYQLPRYSLTNQEEGLEYIEANIVSERPTFF